jgi:hypothetical protein
MKKTFILVASVAMLAVLIGCSGVFEGRANRQTLGLGEFVYTGGEVGDPNENYKKVYGYNPAREAWHYTESFDIAPFYSAGTCIENTTSSSNGQVIPVTAAPFYISVNTFRVPNGSFSDLIIWLQEQSIQDGLQPVYSINGQFNPDNWSRPVDFANLTVNTDRNGYRLPTMPEITSFNAYPEDEANPVWRENVKAVWTYCWGPGGNQRIIYSAYADKIYKTASDYCTTVVRVVRTKLD